MLPQPILSEQAHGLLEQALREGVCVGLHVQGACMEPLLRDGDWVEIRSHAEASAGNIVLAKPTAGELVCHRVLWCSETACSLVGDRALASQEILASQILGVVHKIERDGTVASLESPSMRLVDLWLSRWHSLTIRLRGTFAGRILEIGRRLVLWLRVWHTWGVTTRRSQEIVSVRRVS